MKDNKEGKRGVRQPADRLPPHSVEAEMAILGAILLTDSIFDDVRSRIIGGEAFYDLRNRTIWEAMEEVRSKDRKIDVVLITQVLRDKGTIDQCGGYAYVTSLTDQIANVNLYAYHVDLVIEKWMLRKMIAFMTNAIANAYESAEPHQVLGSIQTALSDCLRGSTVKRHQHIKKFTKQALEELETLYTGSERTKGIETGFADFDAMTGGLQRGELVVLASRPSVGKTSLAMNIAEHVAIDLRKPVGIFALEMTGRALAKRLLGSMSRTNLRQLPEADLPKVIEKATSLMKAPIYLDDSSYIHASELMAKAKVLQAEHNVQLIIVDYLQLIKPDNHKSDKRYLEIGDICKKLHALANELDIPLLLLSQLSRQVDNRKPLLSDLAESSAIEQDADTVALMHKPDPLEPSHIQLYLAKQRNGPTGYIDLLFIPEFTRFESANKAQQEDEEERLPYHD